MNKEFLKSALHSSIQDKIKCSKASTGEIIDHVVRIIKEAVMKEGDKGFRIAGLGTFKLVHRKERMGKNPKTGKAIKIEARWMPRFSAAKEFKDNASSFKPKKK